nr:hypothetical protein [Tanacetum cinerariifolium]
TSSNPRNQATIQDGKVVIQNVQGRQNRGQGNNTRGVGAASYGELKIDKKLLMQARENGVALNEEKLLFIAGGQDNAVDEDVNEQPVGLLFVLILLIFQLLALELMLPWSLKKNTMCLMLFEHINVVNRIYV